MQILQSISTTIRPRLVRQVSSARNLEPYRVALYPGDGIGVDVTESAVKVLETAESTFGTFSLEFTNFNWGCNYYERHGILTPPDYAQTLSKFDSIFLGATGWPAKVPDHLTADVLLGLRRQFDQYANVRPARTFPGVKTPLDCDVDMVIIRENSEGEYANVGGRFAQGTPNEVAMQTAVHTRRGVERVIRYSFEVAEKRQRQKLTMITKSNAQRYAMVMWDDIFEELSMEFPHVQAGRQHIDAAAMNFVLKPESFDVVVASNLFGDILSDLSGAITGSLGLNPSANLNPERRFPSLFEPVHGSAPDIAGTGKANPTGAILSAALMIDWLSVDGSASIAGDAIRAAVAECLARGESTPDVGGNLTTAQMTQSVMTRITHKL
ncbi:hypothetical protein CYMTET_28752 [Cymbomonas tetramitiformis]|uniref:Isopropylmalate dehydrogenase-like domain-containing protein n=1 Tax=Cymbomonas tetramitiformis TaxID=36881 RepID=A0AAE0FMG3_9CHLO|nr:hypothetical protein CYMTET_28752 [Cymbomonas tetramitiformis]